ncbi:MAG: Asd/ArgC dimerization domain-containing protein [Planctomycetota bacterium]|jgi:aspartate-semialdehyde dehydrogenase
MAPASSLSARLPRTLIVGAGGLVGSTLQELLAGRCTALELCAARRARETSTMDELVGGTPPPRLVFLAVDESTARRIAPLLVDAGALVLDFSSAHRLHPQVPLAVAGLATSPPLAAQGLVALPNCTNPALALVLDALGRAGGGLEQVRVHSVQSASGGGRRLLDSLADPAAPLHADVLPAIGALDAHGRSEEEAAVVEELRRLLDMPGLDLAASCLRVPTAVGHGMTVELRCRRALDPAAAAAALAAVPAVRLHEEPPSPRRVDDPDLIHVGRLRAVDPARPGSGLMLWVVADNLRQGAASNAVAVAEAVLAGAD